MEKEIVENLWNGDTESQIQAAMNLGRLSRKQRHMLEASVVMVPLVSMLHSENYEAIEAALCALLSLSFGSDRNKIRIIRTGALPVLLSLLHCDKQTVIQLTLVAMLTLSSCKENKVAIASSGAVRVLAEFVNSNDSTSTQSQLDAIATLHNLTTCQEIIPHIVSSGVMLSLLELIHSSVKSSPLAEKAIGLLENIVSSSESALCEAAGTGGAIRILVETIEDGSLLSKEHAVCILLLICQSCREKYRGLILTEGVMPGLLQLSVDGTWRAKSMAQKLLLLLRDCSNYGSGCKQINHELIERIMEEIEEEEGEKLADTTLKLVVEMIAKLHA
ncbi:U-box domain-containing protein 6 [Cajanus cajan]|uniref:U-box domain-containing protein 6 n=1 Tax=Cajanus cajan TaxID=3821 RepID=A0A151SJ83_CAJCA|nr:U-box domain-containing protein 6 [Cajanus cajan]KYP54860.1 U-box domain-containing protein 6 [Cajanus cajan]